MYKMRAWTLFVAFCLCWPCRRTDAMGTEEIVAMTDVSGIASGMVKLPCDVQVPQPEDRVQLVIWYKEGIYSPIYSFDVRGKSIGDAVHWSDGKILGNRAFYRIKDDPARLIIENLRDQDSGVYRCRVDFKKSPTRNTKVNLTVILPPERISIVTETGQHIPSYVLGPFNEGDNVDIRCEATGGRPSPRVSWWLENALVDDDFTRVSDRTVTNVLRLERLSRSELGHVYTCQASNNLLAAPISSSVSINLNLRPLWVRLRGENRPLSAETVYKLQCECVGARPEPLITWWRGNFQLRDTAIQISSDGNTTVSTLTFIPKLEDSGKILTCKAGTHVIANSTLEDSWKLNIYHIPIVNLELGSNINGSNIREGVDVYFECNIKSNPWVYRVIWKHNGVTLFHNASAGTIVSNQSLVLQSITRARAGLYTCVGSNQEGDGESNPVYLDVKYRPVCRPGQQKVLGVARQEIASVICEIEANPTDVRFMWRFNNSAETIDIPRAHIFNERLRSIAKYTPMTELDFGSLLCWARNEEGVQTEPCVFHVIPSAGKPEGLRNCSILNHTSEILLVECVEGFDGGLPQEFIMEVFDSQTQLMVVNITSKTPSFDVHGLQQNYPYDVAIYASNNKGHSDITFLRVLTLKDAEKRTAGVPILPAFAPLFIIAGGALLAVLFTIILSLLIVRIRQNQSPAKKSEGRDEPDKYTACGEDDNNPDVIPQSSETDYLDPDEKAFERLNNAPPRILASVPRGLQNAAHQAGFSVPELVKSREEVTYADLSLPRQGTCRVLAPSGNRCVIEPTEYAEIDVAQGRQPINYHQISLDAHHDTAVGVRLPLLESSTLPRITATRF